MPRIDRARLIRALERLVRHDEAADKREGLPNCVELQDARDLLLELGSASDAPIEVQMMCGVEQIAYDFEAKVGRLHMPDDHCCDYKGCIAFFTWLDPNVEVILTFSGEAPDTLYDRDRTGRFGAWVRPSLEPENVMFLDQYLRRFQRAIDRSRSVDVKRTAKMKERLGDLQREMIAIVPVDPTVLPS